MRSPAASPTRSEHPRVYEALEGLTVILTRDAPDNLELASRLRAHAGQIIELPCVRTEALSNAGELATALARLHTRDWVVVTSRHGADALAALPTHAQFAAIGQATAQCLRRHGRHVAFVPSAPSGQHLARELPQGEGTVLLARSDRALSEMPRILRERGFDLREVVAYRTLVGARGDTALVRRLLSGSVDRVAVLFHSPSAVAGMVEAIDPRLVARAAVFVVGPSTLRAAREHLGSHARISLLREEVVDVAHR